MTVTVARLDAALSLSPVVMPHAVGRTPDPWQTDLLLAPDPRLCVCAARQSGKTEAAAWLLCHGAVWRRPGSLSVIAAPTQRQSTTLLRRVRETLQLLPDDLRPDVVREGETHLELGNGSRLLAFPGSSKSTRGLTIDGWLVVDEAAFVTVDLLDALEPSLVVAGGRLLAVSTPNIAAGWFWDAYRGAFNGWRRFTVRATEVDRHDPEQLWLMRERMGERRFAREMMCEFQSPTGALLSAEQVEQTYVDAMPAVRFEWQTQPEVA